ncbi:MAG: hypothetical protein OEV64_05810 [Desulfobulbaceae bacterium]|nr:hypothetical protein [Desulfobulbaceae bacterium]
METRLTFGGRGILFICWLVPSLIGLLELGCAFGAEALRADYVSGTGKEVVVRLTVGESAPSPIILIQRFPPGFEVLDARPPAQKTNPAKGEYKWLLRGVTPGTISVRATMNREVSPGELSGEIRYRPSGGGEMIVEPIGR